VSDNSGSISDLPSSYPQVRFVLGLKRMMLAMGMVEGRWFVSMMGNGYKKGSFPMVLVVGEETLLEFTHESPRIYHSWKMNYFNPQYYYASGIL